MNENCPRCNKDISDLPSTTENCPYCGAKLEMDLWDELFDEEKERETLKEFNERKESGKFLKIAAVVCLNVAVFFAAWLIYSISLRHPLGAGLAVGLSITVLLFDLFAAYNWIFERQPKKSEPKTRIQKA